MLANFEPLFERFRVLVERAVGGFLVERRASEHVELRFGGEAFLDCLLKGIARFLEVGLEAGEDLCEGESGGRGDGEGGEGADAGVGGGCGGHCE